MFEKLSRSWALAGQCWNVLRDDKALAIFPIFSALSIVLVGASFSMPVWSLIHATHGNFAPGSTTRHPLYFLMFFFYLVSYAVVTFFNTALVAVALKRLQREPASVTYGLQVALSRLPVIVLYAIVAASVGTVLRALEERVGIIGRVITGLIGLAWTVATAMVIPVLAAEDTGPLGAIERSVTLLRKTWGEDLVGNGGIGLATFFAQIVVVVLGMAIVSVAIQTHAVVLAVLCAVMGIALIILVAVVSATLRSIYSAALYRYAQGDPHWEGFDRDVLEDAFSAR